MRRYRVKFHVSSPFDLTTTYGLWSKCDDNPWSNSLPQPSLSPSSPLNITTTTTSGPGSFTCRPFPSREQDCTNRRLAQIVSKFIARNVVGGSFVGREDVKGTEGDEVEVREARGRLEGQEWGLCESWLTARFVSPSSFSFPSSSSSSRTRPNPPHLTRPNAKLSNATDTPQQCRQYSAHSQSSIFSSFPFEDGYIARTAGRASLVGWGCMVCPFLISSLHRFGLDPLELGRSSGRGEGGWLADVMK